MINNSVTINNVTLNVLQGVTTQKRLDDELWTCTVIALSTSDEPYLPFTNATTILNSEVDRWVVDSDLVALYSINPNIYKHTITLIEEIKKLDKYLCPNIAFSNDLDGTQQTILDQLTRLRAIFPCERYDYFDVTRLFDIPVSIPSEWNNLAPQLFLNRPTVYQALCSILKPLNARPTLSDGILGMLKFNELNDLKDLYNGSVAVINNKSSSRTSEYYSRVLEAEVPNAISEDNNENYVIYPSPSGYATIRSNPVGGIFQTNSACIQLQFPLYELISLRCLVTGTYNHTTSQILAEITSFIYEEQVYQTLDVASSTHIYSAGERYQNNCLYYTYSGTSIDGFGETTKFLIVGSTLVLQNLFNTWKQEASFSDYIIDVGDLNDLLIQLTYKPIVNSVIRQERDDIDDFPNKMILNTNFSENTTNLNRLGTNMISLVNRLGNADLTIRYRYIESGDRFQLGDYLSNGYVATLVEESYFNDYIEGVCQLTKNYNRLSSFVGVDTQYRQYDIPRTGVERHIKHDDYVVIDTVENTANISNNSSLVNSAAYLQLMFLDDYPISNKIHTCGILSIDSNSNLINSAWNNVFSYHSGKSACFTVGFNDTISAGNQKTDYDVISSITYYKQPAVKYGDENGEAYYFTFQFYNDVYNGYSTNQKISLANNYPDFSSSWQPSSASNISIIKLQAEKDRAEIIKLTYQINFVAGNNFIVQESFVKRFPLIRSNGYNTELFLREQVAPFSKSQTTVSTRGSIITGWSVSTNGTNKAVVTKPATTNNWCLCDSSGNIMIACNDPSVTSFVLATTHNR